MTSRPIRHLSLPAMEEKPAYQSSYMTIVKEELDTFFSLLNRSPIKQLLEKDKCYSHVDNYLIAMVFVYFKRSGLSLSEYTVEKFWLCLYLAHDQEEDEKELKWELLPWALGEEWMANYHRFSVEKDELWKRMGCRSLVSRRQCEQIMAISSFPFAWGRARGKEHGGAVRRGEFVQSLPGVTPTCVRCEGKEVKREECYIVAEEMDVEEEEEEDTVDSDSGMETEGELELFPEE